MHRQPDRPKVVFDCNTFIQAIAFEHGPAAECLRLVEAGRIELFVSKSVLAELRRVCAYSEIQAISQNMSTARCAAFLQRLAYRATLLRRVGHAMAYPRDPNDEPYINLAIAAKAHYLVSRDKDLLFLQTGHSSVCQQFRRMRHSLRVLDPVSFLAAIKESSAPDAGDT